MRELSRGGNGDSRKERTPWVRRYEKPLRISRPSPKGSDRETRRKGTGTIFCGASRSTQHPARDTSFPSISRKKAYEHRPAISPSDRLLFHRSRGFFVGAACSPRSVTVSWKNINFPARISSRNMGFRDISKRVARNIGVASARARRYKNYEAVYRCNTVMELDGF